MILLEFLENTFLKIDESYMNYSVTQLNSTPLIVWVSLSWGQRDPNVDRLTTIDMISHKQIDSNRAYKKFKKQIWKLKIVG